jgi:hypothetical protein
LLLRELKLNLNLRACLPWLSTEDRRPVSPFFNGSHCRRNQFGWPVYFADVCHASIRANDYGQYDSPLNSRLSCIGGVERWNLLHQPLFGLIWIERYLTGTVTTVTVALEDGAAPPAGFFSGRAVVPESRNAEETSYRNWLSPLINKIFPMTGPIPLATGENLHFEMVLMSVDSDFESFPSRG